MAHVPHNRKVSDEDFIRFWYELGSAAKLSERTGLDVRNVHGRRRKIESKYKYVWCLRWHAILSTMSVTT
jgi:hypothetical protein